MTLHFTVIGRPAPQGSKRIIGKGMMIESSKHVKPWREAVKWAAFVAMRGYNWTPIDGPCKVTIRFRMPRAEKPKKHLREYPASAPDIDKLIRSTFDALTDAGVWRDDGRVVHTDACKVYADVGPGAEIWIAEV